MRPRVVARKVRRGGGGDRLEERAREPLDVRRVIERATLAGPTRGEENPKESASSESESEAAPSSLDASVCHARTSRGDATPTYRLGNVSLAAKFVGGAPSRAASSHSNPIAGSIRQSTSRSTERRIAASSIPDATASAAALGVGVPSEASVPPGPLPPSYANRASARATTAAAPATREGSTRSPRQAPCANGSTAPSCSARYAQGAFGSRRMSASALRGENTRRYEDSAEGGRFGGFEDSSARRGAPSRERREGSPPPTTRPPLLDPPTTPP